MQRRFFLLTIATFAVSAAAPLAAQMPHGGKGMREKWDEMDHDTRMKAMEHMRGRRHEPRYEEMRERWNRMSPRERERMMDERHSGMPMRRN